VRWATVFVYAREMAGLEFGLAREPEQVEVGGFGFSDPSAWEMWRHQQLQVGLPVGAEVATGPCLVGEIEGGGHVAWRLVLHPAGMRIGCLTSDACISTSDPPRVFGSREEALAEIGRRGLAAKGDLDYLPDSLRTELYPDEDGRMVRAGRRLFVSAGDPVAARVWRKGERDQDPDPVLIRPDWYVSRDQDGQVWAWRPVDRERVSFARIVDRGEWRTARWESVGECPQYLGHIGQIGQEHPTLVVAPEPVKRASLPRLGM